MLRRVALCLLWLPLALACSSRGSGEKQASVVEDLTTATITLTTPPAVAPTAAVIQATGSITVGSIASFSGVVVQESPTGDISIGPEAVFNGDIWAQGAAIIGGLAQIGGTLHDPVVVADPSATIAHTDTNPTFTPPNTLSWTVTLPSGPAPDVHVTSGQSSTLAPGPYGTVSVDAGGTLTLRAGTYLTTNLTASQGSSVKLDQSAGSIIAYVSGTVTLNGAFAPVQAAPPNFLVVYLGNGAVSVGGAAGAPFAGDLIAPNSLLSISSSSAPHVGFFAAQNVLIDALAQVQYAPPTAVVTASGSTSRDGGTDSGDASDSGDGGAGDAGEAGMAGDAGDAGTGISCSFDAGTASQHPACGDGWRDPTEECDDGLKTASGRRACSSTCKVLDQLAVAQLGPDGGLANGRRTLGAGRHTLAASTSTFAISYLEPDSLTLSLAAFTAKGVPTGVTLFRTGPSVVQNSNPVIAALPCDHYAVAWADYSETSGDELDVALQIVTPGTPPTVAPTVVNTTVDFSQYDPDIVVTDSGEIVVAWVDDSDPTGSRLLYRTFDGTGKPTSDEAPVAPATGDSIADVALAPFAGSWAAAWRDDASGLETVRIQAGSAQWTVEPSFLPAPVATKPALVALDATHLLVVYVAGIDSADSGVASGSKLQAAVLDATVPKAVAGLDVPAMVASAVGLDQSSPNAVNVQGSVFVAWWTAAATGDANGEQLWLRPLSWDGTALKLSQTEVSLPRWSQAQAGDQRSPALAASALPPGGALVAAWDDLGRGIGTGEGNGDIVVELAPTPIIRIGTSGGP